MSSVAKITSTTQVQLPLNIVLHGNSILGGGGGVTAPFKPVAIIAALRPTANVTDAASGGGGDIINLRANIGNVTSLYNPARRNIAVLLETSNYINDTRGEWGDGFTLTNPNGAGQAYYDQALLWVASVRAGGFMAMVCTAPAAYETTASPLSNNTLYYQAHAYAHALIRNNPGNVDYVCDLASDSRFQTTTDSTYYDGSQIHLTDAGSSVLGNLIHLALPV